MVNSNLNFFQKFNKVIYLQSWSEKFTSLEPDLYFCVKPTPYLAANPTPLCPKPWPDMHLSRNGTELDASLWLLWPVGFHLKLKL